MLRRGVLGHVVGKGSTGSPATKHLFKTALGHVVAIGKLTRVKFLMSRIFGARNKVLWSEIFLPKTEGSLEYHQFFLYRSHASSFSKSI